MRVKAALDNHIIDPPDMGHLSRIAEMGATKLRLVFKHFFGHDDYQLHTP